MAPTRSTRWLRPARFPALGRGEVHVWRCPAEPTGDAVLDEEESQRAARLLSAPARRRYLAARGALRQIAACYLETDPAALEFAAGARGKPALVAPVDAARLRFNLSHAGDLVLLAFCIGDEVGIDVERTARAVEWAAIASRYFSPAETARLHELPAQRRRRAFFVCWSCKEALGKAHGEGLAATLAALEVPVPLGASPVLVTLPGPWPTGPWFLRTLAPGRGYVGALACATAPSAVRLLSWPCRPARRDPVP